MVMGEMKLTSQRRDHSTLSQKEMTNLIMVSKSAYCVTLLVRAHWDFYLSS